MLGLGLGLYKKTNIPTFSPTDLPNLALWLDASTINTDGSVLNGNQISLWKDKSDNGDNAIQTNATNQPVYDGINKSVVFDGDDLDCFPQSVKVIFLVVSNIIGKDFNNTEIGILSTASDSINLYKNDKTANLSGDFVGSMTVDNGVGVSGGDIIITNPAGFTTYPWESSKKDILMFTLGKSTSNIIKIMQQRPTFNDGKGTIYEIIGLNSVDEFLKVRNYLNSKWGAY